MSLLQITCWSFKQTKKGLIWMLNCDFLSWIRERLVILITVLQGGELVSVI